MRKKFTMLLAALLLGVGAAWAQVSYTVSPTTGTGYSGEGYFKNWSFIVSDANPAELKLTVGANNMRVKNEQLELWVGSGCTYTLQVPVFYRIVSYSFNFKKESDYTENVTLTVGEETFAADTETKTVTVNNVNATSTSFKMTGANKGIVVTDFVVKIEEFSIELTEDLDNPKYYTIKNARGGVYAQYNGAGQKMQLSSAADTKGHLFYFTKGSVDGTYKIHNAATTNKCEETNKWTADGIDWYILKSGNTSNPGYAISKGTDLTQQKAWNNESGKNLRIAYWDGNDAGSTWVIEPFVEAPSLLGLKMSTNDTKYLYNIKNDRKSKFANFAGSGVFTQADGTNPGSYWYFVEVPGVENVPEGYKACYIYNAANDLAVQNHANGHMSSPTDENYPAKVYFVGPYEATYWGYVIYPQGSSKGWNDFTGSSVTDYDYKTDGSIWDILPADKTEATLISEAGTAKTNALDKIAPYDYADYYTYADDAIATAKAAVETATNNTLKNALSGHMAINKAISDLESSAKGAAAPAAGDIIQLKHRNDKKYLKDNGTNANNTENQDDLATLWRVEEGDNGNVKLKNVSTNKYIGQIRKSVAVTMQEDVANAAQFAWTNQTGTYAVFKDVNTEGVAEGDLNFLYGHVNTGNLVGWEPGENSQWLVSKRHIFTITYKLNDVVQSEVTEYVKEGATYTVSPLAFTAPSAVTVDGTAIEPTDGVFSFKATKNVSVTVELVEDVPFVKTELEADGSFPENTVWYVVKQHSNPNETKIWKYDADNGVTTENTTTYTENHLWCFAGSKDDLKIYNKVAGSSVSLTNADPASMAETNAAVWKMVKSDNEYSFEGKGPFCLEGGPTSSDPYLNMQGDKLKYWNDNDYGSTIMVIACQPLSIKYMFKGEEITTLSENKLVEVGSTHTITNPYANKYVNVTCTVNGNKVEPVDGQWSVEVAEATEVIVTITEDLPFKTSTDFANANWQYMQINSAAWEYVQNDGEAPYSNTTDAANLGDGALWAFVGDALNGFQILNKAAGEGYTLSSDDTKDGTAAYMKQEEKTWTIEKGNGGFIIRQGNTECLNDYGNQLKYWNASGSPTGTGSAFRTIQAGVKNSSDLCNNKVYTVTPANNKTTGAWDVKYDEGGNATMLAITEFTENAVDPTSKNQQFAFLNVNGEYYLYSYGADKFVAEDGTGQKLTTDLTEKCLVTFDASTITDKAIYPLCVRVGGDHLCASSAAHWSGNGGIVTNWNDTGDAGNAVAIVAVEGEVDLSAAIAKVEAYQKTRLMTTFNELVYAARGYVNWMDWGRYTHESGKGVVELGADVEAIDSKVNESSTIAEIESAIDAIEVFINGFNIKLPTPGFYYFVSYDYNDAGEYLSDDRKGDDETQRVLTEDVSEKNIFYYDGTTLVAYASGFGFEFGICNTKNTETKNTFEFGMAYKPGKYTVISSEKRWDDGYWKNNNGELARVNAADASGWDIVSVPSLPVTVGSRLYATFFAPVAVTIPGGVKAYTGEVNGEWLTLTEVKGTIPAETPVVLIAQEGNKTFQFTIVESEATAIGSHLHGTTPTIANDKKEIGDDMYYTMQAHGDGVAFKRYKGDNLGGFKAYLQVPAGNNATALRIKIAGTTGIEGSELDAQDTLLIFDLAGRRVEKMEKGIYIVNGRKVIVK